MLIDLNSGSGFVYGALSAVCDAGVRINTLIDAALEAEHRSQPQRDYLGGSRIGEPCARRLAYEVTLAPVGDGKDFCGRLLRIFDAGHEFEELTIRWLQAAGPPRISRRPSSSHSSTHSVRCRSCGCRARGGSPS